MKGSSIYPTLVWAGTLLFNCLWLSFSLLSGSINVITFIEWEFFSRCGLSLGITVLVDFLGVVFSFVVCLIRSCVFLFRVKYIEEDKFVNLFSWLVACFVGAMNILIYIPHLMFMLLGWDLLGIVSFLLVIYYQNIVSVGAGILTILINRLGDVFLLLSIGLISVTGTWGVLRYDNFNQNSYVMVLVGVLLVSACITKRAQIPFSVWLPAAMAAPTPVSALVHSSTLVTAGVYIIFRYYSFFSAVDGLLLIRRKLGCMTLLMASLAACFELDIKKLIALSTLGHLGFIVYVLGLGYPALGFFHMVIHALFKSLLFLCAGYYIHMIRSSQDIRQLSGVGWGSSPLVVSCTIIGFISLCGVPYLRGFYSKDAILERSLRCFNGVFEVVSILLSASISYVYSIRILLKAVFGPLGRISLRNVSFGGWFVGIPVVVLTLGRVVFGVFLQELWAESCQTFVIRELVKVCLFFVLNIGNFVMILEKFSCRVFNHIESFQKFYLIAIKICGRMWFLRWMFDWVLVMWYENVRKTIIVLELGWIEILGGHLIFLRFGKTRVKLWILEYIRILTVLRFRAVILLAWVVFYFL